MFAVVCITLSISKQLEWAYLWDCDFVFVTSWVFLFGRCFFRFLSSSPSAFLFLREKTTHTHTSFAVVHNVYKASYVFCSHRFLEHFWIASCTKIYRHIIISGSYVSKVRINNQKSSKFYEETKKSLLSFIHSFRFGLNSTSILGVGPKGWNEFSEICLAKKKERLRQHHDIDLIVFIPFQLYFFFLFRIFQSEYMSTLDEERDSEREQEKATKRHSHSYI